LIDPRLAGSKEYDPAKRGIEKTISYDPAKRGVSQSPKELGYKN